MTGFAKYMPEEKYVVIHDGFATKGMEGLHAGRKI